MSGISVLVEKDSHISSGGVSGLSIGLSDFFHMNLVIVNFSIKTIIFLLVLTFGGQTTAFWTIVGACLTGFSMWAFSLLPIDLDWPKWMAFSFILLFSKFPIGLLVSRGYSTGGFTSLGQLLQAGLKLPLSISLFLLNALTILAMVATHGFMSGFLTAMIALSSGFTTEAWAYATKKYLDKSPPVSSNH